MQNGFSCSTYLSISNFLNHNHKSREIPPEIQKSLRNFEGFQKSGKSRTLFWLVIHPSFCSASESSNQNLPDRTLDLPIFFHYKHITSLKIFPSPAPSESLPYWFQRNFLAMFVLSYWLSEFRLSEITNRFELRCKPKQLMLIY